MGMGMGKGKGKGTRRERKRLSGIARFCGFWLIIHRILRFCIKHIWRNWRLLASLCMGKGKNYAHLSRRPSKIYYWVYQIWYQIPRLAEKSYKTIPSSCSFISLDFSTANHLSLRFPSSHPLHYQKSCNSTVNFFTTCIQTSLISK